MTADWWQLNHLGREPTASEVAEAGGIPLEEVEKVLHVFHGQPVSLNGWMGSSGCCFEEFIADKDALSPL